ncbi:hypothetical protein GUITHDRAFT_131990 [Guillardia theta CCMP2712]|uniref:Uncharacterized protein n=1 Tax=Guillardia theta (strain CCMP2712) TaxID=905079 RepID=L1K378_GUITC|nr:hypothetical protein GUITHDRAFT_131990 [Guillardia theta CCMP2712]EKX55047.1 hypothetical protein GUITHDRAFT_131990 [Guillardia theta CCMP2712]|eukprot:XP_005842027.1 hypothetical protein GUITHDRAFT_131990 [Guillardia theta CCMP2712]
MREISSLTELVKILDKTFLEAENSQGQHDSSRPANPAPAANRQNIASLDKDTIRLGKYLLVKHLLVKYLLVKYLLIHRFLNSTQGPDPLDADNVTRCNQLQARRKAAAADAGLLHLELWVGAVVAGELQGDEDVVLHAPHLPAQRELVLVEDRHRALDLVGVGLQLLPEPALHPAGFTAHKVLPQVDAPVPQHRVEHRAHGVLDLQRRHHAVPLRPVVDAEADVAQAVEVLMVVLRLEAPGNDQNQPGL